MYTAVIWSTKGAREWPGLSRLVVDWAAGSRTDAPSLISRLSTLYQTMDPHPDARRPVAPSISVREQGEVVCLSWIGLVSQGQLDAGKLVEFKDMRSVDTVDLFLGEA